MSWYLTQVVAGNQQKNVAGSQWCSVTVRAESRCQCQVSSSCLGWCPLSLPVSDLECCDSLSLGNTPQSLDRRVTLHLRSAAGPMADYRPWIQTAMTFFFFLLQAYFMKKNWDQSLSDLFLPLASSGGASFHGCDTFSTSLLWGTDGPQNRPRVLNLCMSCVMTSIQSAPQELPWSVCTLHGKAERWWGK